MGAQVPVGAGLAFANKYNARPGENMDVAIAGYGDGAANQGQIWESANMAKLWNLPLILYIENNHYGMGTATKRHSCNDEYYTMGGRVIPGIRIDGMNVLAVKQGMQMAKEYCATGNGPMYVEFDTYRFHGHSMSDPGNSYRTREEVTGVRQAKDPIEYVKKLLVEYNMSTPEELKSLEKELRTDVENALARAKTGKFAPIDEAFKDIYASDKLTNEYPPFLRLPDYHKSLKFA